MTPPFSLKLPVVQRLAIVPTGVKVGCRFTNGLIFLGYLLAFDYWKRPVRLIIIAAGVWIIAAVIMYPLASWPGTQSAVLQLACFIGYSCVATGLTYIFFMRTEVPTSNPKLLQRQDGPRVLLYTLLLTAILVLGLLPRYSILLGQLSALPLPGAFGLVLIARKTPENLRTMRALVLFGPILAMTFVFLISRAVGLGLWPCHSGSAMLHYLWESDWGCQSLFLLLPAWATCFGVVWCSSWVYGLLEQKA